MTVTEMKTFSVKSTAKSEAASPRPKPRPYKMTGTDDKVKVMLFGGLGTGKTKFLEGPIESGERLLVMSTDFGNNGLLTVKNSLRRKGKANLLETNLLNIDLGEYKDVIGFLDNPLEYIPDLHLFDPTGLAWDGFSTFNSDYLDEYSEKENEFRSLGDDKFGHWYDVKRATLRVLRKFFQFVHPDGRNLYKIMTTIEAKPDVNEYTQVTERAPLIQGGAKEFTGGGFDLVMQCFKEDKDGKERFYYRTAGAKFAIKNRDFDLKPIEDADPARIWGVLTGK
jgi:AAA domain